MGLGTTAPCFGPPRRAVRTTHTGSCPRESPIRAPSGEGHELHHSIATIGEGAWRDWRVPDADRRDEGSQAQKGPLHRRYTRKVSCPGRYEVRLHERATQILLPACLDSYAYPASTIGNRTHRAGRRTFFRLLYSWVHRGEIVESLTTTSLSRSQTLEKRPSSR